VLWVSGLGFLDFEFRVSGLEDLVHESVVALRVRIAPLRHAPLPAKRRLRTRGGAGLSGRQPLVFHSFVACLLAAVGKPGRQMHNYGK
jgi:hypothetical protein